MDGKFAIKKDLDALSMVKKVTKAYIEASQNNRLSLYYFFEDSVKRRQNEDCIWSREGCFTWSQADERVNQYAQWFLSQGVQPNDLVSFYMMNSPDFIFAWLALWAIGAAPAMINYNLAGNALIHCLKVAGSGLILVDQDADLVARIDEVRTEIEQALTMKIHVLDACAKDAIFSLKPERPDDLFRERVKGNSPMSIFYTRSVLSSSKFWMSLMFQSGTTGMPKGVPFNVDRGFQVGASVCLLRFCFASQI